MLLEVTRKRITLIKSNNQKEPLVLKKQGAFAVYKVRHTVHKSFHNIYAASE